MLIVLAGVVLVVPSAGWVLWHEWLVAWQYERPYYSSSYEPGVEVAVFRSPWRAWWQARRFERRHRSIPSWRRRLAPAWYGWRYSRRAYLRSVVRVEIVRRSTRSGRSRLVETWTFRSVPRSAKMKAWIEEQLGPPLEMPSSGAFPGSESIGVDESLMLPLWIVAALVGGAFLRVGVPRESVDYVRQGLMATRVLGLLMLALAIAMSVLAMASRRKRARRLR